jgi:hypothetical protein
VPHAPNSPQLPGDRQAAAAAHATIIHSDVKRSIPDSFPVSISLDYFVAKPTPKRMRVRSLAAGREFSKIVRNMGG